MTSAVTVTPQHASPYRLAVQGTAAIDVNTVGNYIALGLEDSRLWYAQASLSMKLLYLTDSTYNIASCSSCAFLLLQVPYLYSVKG